MINYYYSPYGNVSKYTRTGISDLVKSNDGLGRISSRSQGDKQALFTYDALGKLTSQTDAFNLAASYVYDTDTDRLESVTAGNKTFTYEYFADGMVKKLIYPVSGMETEYAYDNANRMTSMVTRKGTTVIASFAYTYDAN